MTTYICLYFTFITFPIPKVVDEVGYEPFNSMVHSHMLQSSKLQPHPSPLDLSLGAPQEKNPIPIRFRFRRYEALAAKMLQLP